MTAAFRQKPTIVLNHVKALRRRHQDIDDRVDAENRRVNPDASLLQRLKRERLRLRDELVRYDGLQRRGASGAVPT